MIFRQNRKNNDLWNDVDWLLEVLVYKGFRIIVVKFLNFVVIQGVM